ncbi:uncharacterized protein LAJ45_07025 [Morchella importuna]|uniref:uncharacterized protein n=1 Tax=Morchella importuna TaxID=1174673 RepID=UPI001E8D05F4|nr:uncharacterized protein LAJ45_07025 [Morchella importuna]KAH8149049.1 hypothetical protein LAJ45_07025 [Morchella importuna]
MAQALEQQLNLGPQPDLPLAGQGNIIIQLLQQIQGTIQQVQQHDIQQVHIRAESGATGVALLIPGAERPLIGTYVVIAGIGMDEGIYSYVLGCSEK